MLPPSDGGVVVAMFGDGLFAGVVGGGAGGGVVAGGGFAGGVVAGFAAGVVGGFGFPLPWGFPITSKLVNNTPKARKRTKNKKKNQRLIFITMSLPHPLSGN